MKIRNILLLFIPLSLIYGFSQEDNKARVKPPVNVKGLLFEQKSTIPQGIPVENITISGLYQQIPVYKKPLYPTSNPDINTIKLDLIEISEIRVPTHQKGPIFNEFNGREYITIEVILNDGKTKNEYIIERKKKILCDEPSQAGPIERELLFEAIMLLKITDYVETIVKKRSPHYHTIRIRR